MFRKQWQGGFRAEIHIGFVHKHNPVWIAEQDAFDRSAGKRHTGGRIRICEDAHAGRCTQRIHIHGKILPQGNYVCSYPIERSVNGIKAVADIRENSRRLRIAESHKGKGEDFIRTIGKKHIRGLYAVMGGKGIAQAHPCWIGIKVKPCQLRIRNRTARARGRGVG